MGKEQRTDTGGLSKNIDKRFTERPGRRILSTETENVRGVFLDDLFPEDT